MKIKKCLAKSTAVRAALVLLVVLGSISFAASAKPIEIEHFVSPAWAQLGFETYQKLADMFNQMQDEVQVKVVMGTGNYEEQVVTRVLGGAAPDVTTSNKYGDLAPKGVFQPLNKFIERDNMLKQLLPPAIEQVTWDGEILMLPQVAQPFITYYNPSLFGMAGATDPYTLHKQGRWTWETVSSSAKKISADKDGDGKLDIWGMGAPVHWQQRTVIWVVQAGGKYFDKWVNPTRGTYDSPAVVQALSFMKELIDTQAMPLEGAITANHVPRFTAGTNGMIFEGPWTMGTMRKANWFDWDLAPLPKGPANAGTSMMIDGVQMMKASPNQEAAWKWMQFLVLNQDAYTVFTQATGRPPAALKGLQAYLKTVVVDGKPHNTDAIANAMMNSVVGPCIPIVTNISAIGSVFGTEITKFLKNEQSLEASLKKINDVANQTIQAAKSIK